ncbi:ABC transporter substrate-binding protein [Propionibacterium sp.]|uniref:ABC transporter substrate-binding protein n=1 Tax=Propionibacterium sp. TaxID=1977903 RepID=UPI0039E73522
MLIRHGKLWARLLALVLLAPMFVACSQSTQSSNSASASSTASSFAFTDSDGRVVEIPTHVKTIAPSGPLAQMVLFAVAPDKLGGLGSKWTDEAKQYIPQKYQDLPVFGQLYGGGGTTLNKEALAAAHPDLIIDVGEKKSTSTQDMDQLQSSLGIPTIFIEASLDTMPQAFRTLGKVLDENAQGEKLASYCDEIYSKTKSTMATITDKKKGLYVVNDSGTNVLAKGSFQSQVLDLMTDNVAVVDNPSASGTGNQVSMEQVVQWNPDVILFGSSAMIGTARTDPTWSSLAAVKSNNIYLTPSQPWNWIASPPSINRYMGMVWLGYLLYPDKFNYDLRTETNRFYQLFYHSAELTDAQYSKLTDQATRH